MKHKIEAVILPTEDITDIIYNDSLDILVYKSHKDFSDYGVQNNKHISYQHLYIIVSQDVESIKEGDWTYDTLNNCIEQVNKSTVDMINAGMLHNDNRKIIATNDPKLTSIVKQLELEGHSRPSELLPQVQQSFLKEFVANPDGEYEVEYEEDYDDTPLGKESWNILKLNKDNTVNITSVKEKIYSKEKLKSMFRKIFIEGGKCARNFNYDFDVDDWIKENL